MTRWIGAFLAVSAMSGSASQPDSLMTWVRQNAVQLRDRGSRDDSDLRALSAVITPGVKVIGFGESRHGAREYLAVRNRWFKYLVENHGVTAYAAETSITAAMAIDDYVTAAGRPDLIDKTVARYAYVADPDSTAVMQENEELVEWIRSYNRRPQTRRLIHFYGVDNCPRMPREYRGQTLCMRPALTAALSYVRSVDPKIAVEFERRFEVFVRNQALQRQVDGLARLGPREREDLAAAFPDFTNVFLQRRVAWIRRSSAFEYDRARRNAIVAGQLHSNSRSYDEEAERDWKWSLRDGAMADNVLWALEREGAGGRVFFFAANSHLDKGAQSQAGSHLATVLGEEFKVVGAFDGFPGGIGLEYYPSFAQLLDAVGGSSFFVDLRGMPPLATTESEARAATGRLDDAISYPHWRVQGSFDGAVFLKIMDVEHR